MKELAENPFAFDFYYAVRLLQCRHPEQPPIGCSISPNDDPIRFGQDPSLAFAPSSLQGFKPGAEGRPPKMRVNFFGLFGPHGPLPLHLTEFAHERQTNAGDPTLVSFLDAFHHRLISLFFRAWAVNQKAVDYDQREQSRFAGYLGSFFGMGMKSLCRRDALPDAAKLHYSGRLACPTHNAEGLQAILQDYFGIPTTVENFVGQWLDLPPDCICRVGETPETGSLGRTVIAGARTWDCQLKFRLKLGPMTLADLKRLLPNGAAFQRLKCWILNYTGREFFWDVQLILKADEVPETQLGGAGYLGWTTWVRTAPFRRDAEDLILIPPDE